MQLEALGGELLAAARFPVNHTDDGPENGALRAELDGGVEDRTAGGHDIFDDAEPLAPELAAFGQPLGIVPSTEADGVLSDIVSE